MRAKVFREGHDAVNATAVLTDPEGRDHYFAMRSVNPGLSEWSATVVANRPGWWTYRVEGWSDPYATWLRRRDQDRAGVDEELMCAEGVRILGRFADAVRGQGTDASEIDKGVAALKDTTRPAATASVRQAPPRSAASRRSCRCASSSPPGRSTASSSSASGPSTARGTRSSPAPRAHTATRRREMELWHVPLSGEAAAAIADMGFEVVYLTPIHPIGTTARKGRNNSLTAEPGDPGSPYAIGSPDGGHDAIHPDLGTFEDFDFFVAEAGVTAWVALDIALQASPDHPWVQTRSCSRPADGTIAYAENPPKKYQDIYPLNFDNDPAGAYAEVRRVIQVWLDHGVRSSASTTRTPSRSPSGSGSPTSPWTTPRRSGSPRPSPPAMMHALAKAGFQQSYTYYAWRNAAWELEEYGRELSGDAAAYMRPSFCDDARHPHPLHAVRRPRHGSCGRRSRRRWSPTYGIYAGYELMEHVARPGPRSRSTTRSTSTRTASGISTSPAARSRAGPSRGTSSGSTRSAAPGAALAAQPPLPHRRRRQLPRLLQDARRGRSARRARRRNLDPHATRETWVHLDLEAIGPATWSTFDAHDHVTNQTWTWRADNYVRLGPDSEPVHIIHVRSH